MTQSFLSLVDQVAAGPQVVAMVVVVVVVEIMEEETLEVHQVNSQFLVRRLSHCNSAKENQDQKHDQIFVPHPPFTGYACPLKKDLDCETDNTPTAHPDPKDCRRFIKCSQVSIIITTFSTTTVDTATLNLFRKSLLWNHVAMRLGLTRSVKFNIEFFSEL